MRHRIPQRHPRLTRSRVLAGVTALLAVIAVAAGCSSDRGSRPDTIGRPAARQRSRPRALRRRWRGPRRSACRSRPSVWTPR